MGFGIVALIVAIALCGLGMVMDRNGRKADRNRGLRARLPR